MSERFLNDRSREAVDQLQVVADEIGVTLTALSVAWRLVITVSTVGLQVTNVATGDNDTRTAAK